MTATVIPFPSKAKPRPISRQPYADDYRSFTEQRNALLRAIFGGQRPSDPEPPEPTAPASAGAGT